MTSGAQTCRVRERVDLVYEEIGSPDGLPCIVMWGDLSGRLVAHDLGQSTLEAGQAAGVELRIILPDRRNMGTSSFCLEGDMSLLEEEAEDIHALMLTLKLGPVVMVGVGSGARTSMLVASRHPESVCGLIMYAPTGGGKTNPVSIRGLGFAYYMQYAKAAQKANSMDVLMTFGHYKEYCEASTTNRAALLATPVASFIECMQRAQAFLEQFADAKILGVTDDELGALSHPTLLIHSGHTVEKLHDLSIAQEAAATMPNSELLIDPEFVYPWLKFPSLSQSRIGQFLADRAAAMAAHGTGQGVTGQAGLSVSHSKL